MKRTILLVTAKAPPQALKFILPDLQSRFVSGIVFQIRELVDEQKMQALQMRAKYFGLKMDDSVAHFLLNHFSRDMNSLFSILRTLDKAALQAKRRLTIPFVKKIMNNE